MELFLHRKQGIRPWVACFMAKLIMCKKWASKDEVALDHVTVIKMLKMARKTMHHMPVLSPVVNGKFNVTFVINMVI